MRRRSPGRVRLADVADAAGVSVSTVAKVVNGSGGTRVSEKTAADVRKAAEKLGYRPNASARGIRTGRFGAVALTFGSVVGIFPAVIRTLITAGAQHDVSIVLAELPPSTASRQRLPRILREFAVDGLLLHFSNEEVSGVESLLEEFHIPGIWINMKLPRNCVHFDDVQAGRLMTQRLLEHGHRRIALVEPHAIFHYSGADRLAGYEQAMRDAGLSPVISRAPAKESVADCFERMRSLFQEQQAPTGVVMPSDAHMPQLLEAAFDQGLRPGTEISLIGVGNRPQIAFGLDVTRLSLPVVDLARVGLRTLLRHIDQPDIAEPTVALPYVQWHEGETVRPPRPDVPSESRRRRSHRQSDR